MNIELINTFGNEIDRVNTYHFISDTEKDNYFTSVYNVIINTSYYPPYYTNRIKLSTDDYDIFKGNALHIYKYLRFKFNGKYYYYFIDRINYISEYVYELVITMDTYITYMNDVEVTDICIERKFIDRWNSDDTINRKYLRENVSKANFKLLDKNIQDYRTSNDATSGVIVFKCSERLDTSGCFNTLFRYSSIGTKYSPNCYYFYYLPFNDDIITENEFTVQTYDTDKKVWNDTYKSKEFHLTLTEIIALNQVVEAYIVPFNPFREYFSIVGTKIRLSANYYKSGNVIGIDNDHGLKNVNSFVIGLKIHSVLCNYFTSNYTMPFETNKNNNTLFDKKYIPCLMDSNYYRVSFGERNKQCTENIEYLTNQNLKFYYEPHADGSRMYIPNTDFYYQSMFAEDKFHLPLTHNEWNNYNCYNASSIGMAMGNYVLRCFSFGYGTNSNLNALSNETTARIEGIYDTPKYLDKRYNYPHLNTRGGGMVSSLLTEEEESYRRANVQAVNQGIANTGSLVGTATQEWNAWLAPNTVRQNFDIDSKITSKAMEISLQTYCVEDIEQVAQFYHRNGYLVNEWISDSKLLEELISYVSTRHYYNVIKLASCELHPFNYTISEDILFDIKNRLMNGLRIWNTQVTMLDYSYDNVEEKYL